MSFALPLHETSKLMVWDLGTEVQSKIMQ